MIEITEGTDGVIEFDATGEITADDVESTIAFLRPRMEGKEKLRIMTDLVGLKSITMDAISKDIQEGVKLLRYLDSPMRYAVVTDEEWIAKLAKFESLLLPNGEIRTFPVAEKTQAREWAAQDG